MLQFLRMSQSTLKLFINRLSTFMIIKNSSTPLYARIATYSLTLSNSTGFFWAIYLPPNTCKTNTNKVDHRLLYETACLISNLKLHTTLPGQIELSSTLILLIHMPFLHWNSADKQSRGVVGATVVVHVGVKHPVKET